MSIHIGALIKSKIKEKGLIIDRVADRIGMTNTALHKNFAKENLNTDFIRKLSEVVQYNFFLAIGNGDGLMIDEKGDNDYLGDTPVLRIIEKVDEYKEKYFKLLEKYSVCQEENKSLIQQINK